jgi:hypothetical protein
MKYFLLYFFFQITTLFLSAQPIWNDYEMSFYLIDRNNEIITPSNKDYIVYHSFCHSAKTDTFQYSLEDNYYFHRYTISNSTGFVRHFTINIINGADTMIIYNSYGFKGDTIQFKKGEYYISEDYYLSRKIKLYNSTKIVGISWEDMKLENLIHKPYYQLQLKSELKPYSTYFKEISPTNDFIAFNLVESNKGLEIISSSSLEQILINREYKKMLNTLWSLNNSFSIEDTILSNFFRGELNWKDINTLTFAILSDMQFYDENTYLITINPPGKSKTCYISQDKGNTWHDIFTHPVLDIKLIINHAKNLVIIAGNEFYISKNRGKKWKKRKIGAQENIFIYDLEFPDHKTIIALTCTESEDIMYKSIDNGRNWTKLFGYSGHYNQSFLYSRRYFSLNYNCFEYVNGYLVATFFGRGFFFVSKDKGNTWELVNNECRTILKDKKLYVWYKGKAETIIADNPKDYLHY